MKLRIFMLVPLCVLSVLAPAHARQPERTLIEIKGGGAIVWAGNAGGAQVQIRSRSWKFGTQPDGDEVNEKPPEFAANRQVRLLMRDGTVIHPVEEPFASRFGSWGKMWFIEFYRFPAAAAAEAHAIVVQLGDQVYTERIVHQPR